MRRREGPAPLNLQNEGLKQTLSRRAACISIAALAVCHLEQLTQTRSLGFPIRKVERWRCRPQRAARAERMAQGRALGHSATIVALSAPDSQAQSARRGAAREQAPGEGQGGPETQREPRPTGWKPARERAPRREAPPARALQGARLCYLTATRPPPSRRLSAARHGAGAPTVTAAFGTAPSPATRLALTPSRPPWWPGWSLCADGWPYPSGPAASADQVYGSPPWRGRAGKRMGRTRTRSRRRTGCTTAPAMTGRA